MDYSLGIWEIELNGYQYSFWGTQVVYSKTFY